MAIREPELGVVSAAARVDRRTKDLAQRVRAGEIAVIDHEDLDRVAAESLVSAGVVAVVNAAQSISGRYPNVGPFLLVAAGVILIDGVGSNVMDKIVDGQMLTLIGDEIWDGSIKLAQGTIQTIELLENQIDDARATMGHELARFAENTLEYLQRERHLVTDPPDLPDIDVDFRGRQVLVVVRGVDHREDLAALKRVGYIRELKPVIIGVDGGADSLIESGIKPDVIVGDFDSVRESTLRCGAVLVVHAYPGGRAPGAKRLDDLGLDYELFESVGTSEDIAFLLAYDKGAELIVTVGAHNAMEDFLDKGRAGMASTFLVRLKVGSRLVDAKGVSHLYQPRIGRVDLVLLVVAALFAMTIATAMNEPVRALFHSLWYILR
ncbi:MAG: putative cytokinetic ring protein SteA [Acidimicrobiia bacterium]